MYIQLTEQSPGIDVKREREIDGLLFSTFSNQFTFRRIIHPAWNLLTEYVLSLSNCMGSSMFSFQRRRHIQCI